jgi:hypothetical protein
VFNPLKSDKNSVKLIILSVLLFIAAFVFWNLSEMALSDAEREYGNIVQLRTENRALSAAQIEAVLKKRNAEGEDTKYTGWSQEDDKLYYYGDNYGIFNLILDNGCALSKQAAFNYFGTAEGILGEEVKINGLSYTLEKLLPNDAASAVFKVCEESKAGFDALNIISGAGKAVSASELYMNYRISGDIIIDYSTVIKFFGGAARLLLWAAFLTAAYFILRAVFKELDKPVRKAVILCGLLAAAAVCYLCVGSPLYIPDSFVPTRWSEFEFWAGAFERQGSAVSYYFSMKTYVPDSVFRTHIMKALAFSLICAISLIIAGAAAGRILKERGIGIGVDNIKKHYETLRG